MSDGMNIKELMDLIELRKNEPKKYDQFLKDLVIVSKDIFKIAMKVTEEVQNEE